MTFLPADLTPPQVFLPTDLVPLQALTSHIRAMRAVYFLRDGRLSRDIVINADGAGIFAAQAQKSRQSALIDLISEMVC